MLMQGGNREWHLEVVEGSHPWLWYLCLGIKQVLDHSTAKNRRV